MLPSIGKFEDAFYCLKTGVVGDHERPHKPVLLLSVMDLIASGEVGENLIPYSDSLRKRFAEYYRIVRKVSDSRSPQAGMPFYHLRSDEFWSHVPNPGFEGVLASGGKLRSVGEIRRIIHGARLDPTLWGFLRVPTSRERLREVLITRYFPERQDELRSLIGIDGSQSLVNQVLLAPASEGRSAGFRRKVAEVYKDQCAACGLSIKVGTYNLIEAAHLIPFAESRNDHPRNGMALCRNHHWAMDRHLIAPTSDLRWRTSSVLDDRRPGENALLELSGRELILPEEEAYHPLREALEWREIRLATER